MREVLYPDGHILDAIANGPFKWSTVLGEWIDNAFDAGATSITFEIGRELVIVDDGKGCADPRIMVKLGSHTRHQTTRLGRYGIGMKDAALLVGGVDSRITIVTTHGGKLRTFSVDWTQHQRDWSVDSPVEVDAEQNPPGTRIQISRVARTVPYGQDWKALLSELGYIYSSALKKGKQIKFKRNHRSVAETVAAWEPPTMSDVIDVRITVGGRGARVYCGFVSDGPNPRGGFTYRHAWRVIKQSSSHGCGSYSSARVCGFVDLDDNWPLTRNKDAIGRDREALYAEVERVCEPTLKKAHLAGVSLESAAVVADVSEELNQALGIVRAKAKRKKGETHGSHPPTGDGAHHTKANTEQDGERFPRRNTGFRITPTTLGDANLVGEVKSPDVLINLDNPRVHEAWVSQDRRSLLLIAAALLASFYSYAPKGQPILSGLERGIRPEDFSRALGTILAAPTRLNGVSIEKHVSLDHTEASS